MLKIFLLLTIAQVVDASTAKAAAQRTFMSNVQQQLEVLPAARQTAINALLESIKEDQAADGLTDDQKNNLAIAVSILVELYDYYSEAMQGLQTYYDDQVAVVNACNQENEAEYAAGAAEITSNDLAHSTCRAEEKPLWDDHVTECNEFRGFLTSQASTLSQHPPLVHCTPQAAPKEPADTVDVAAQWATQVEQAHIHWAGADARFDELKGPCLTAFGLAKTKNTECRGFQQTFQTNFCTRMTQRSDICTSRASCYSRENSHRSDLATNYTAISATRVHIIQVLKKAVCYLKVIANGTDPDLDPQAIVYQIDEITPEQLNNTYCPTLDTNGPEFANYKLNITQPDDQDDCPMGPFDVANWTVFHTNYFSSIDLWSPTGVHHDSVWAEDPECPGLS